jgi:hypothetical protein
MARTLLRLPVLLAQEALEVVPVLLGMCEHRALGTHEGSDLRPSLGAAQIIPVLERPRLLVQCVELPGERRVVIGEGADLRLIGVLLLHALRTRRVHVGPGAHSGGLHRTALLSLAVHEGAARNSAHRYVGVSLLAVLAAVWRLVTRVR